MCICQECGREYKVDLIVPDNLWKEISRGKKMLCPVCIAEELEKMGKYDYWFLSKSISVTTDSCYG